ncbi:hypothetical protein [Geomicrobium sp. JCM 19039]|uniref:hypothetical protein n=1 Tax=Geomicrobium sp. JCM 19039 TaxID=1460636 RepID=UPI00045F423A|nr:hypothetical protein [Geomicrobium sp. JCM 19039]GAK12761.1 hypothetical protein JCM19039_2560 [Geomicrobium sp. JCM 19039]
MPPNYLAESLVAVIAQRLVYTDTKRDAFVHQRKADYQFLTGDELREELHRFAGEALPSSSIPYSVGR